MESLKKKFDIALKRFVKKGKLLGICVGMQVLLDRAENKKMKGFGLIKGSVEKMINSKISFPHIGWNELIKYLKFFIFKILNQNNVLFSS